MPIVGKEEKKLNHVSIFHFDNKEEFLEELENA